LREIQSLVSQNPLQSVSIPSNPYGLKITEQALKEYWGYPLITVPDMPNPGLFTLAISRFYLCNICCIIFVDNDRDICGAKTTRILDDPISIIAK
jgi:hypothetical protein